MIRRIIHIDTERCNGCGACAQACHEGAIAMVNGKAQLMREDYCDGLGDCLPACPMDAISFEEREAPAYDAEAVRRAQEAAAARREAAAERTERTTVQSRLTNWPVQIRLAPVQAPCFDGAELLIAADCTAYAFADFHERFLAGRVALVGCPKLDAVQYADKLRQILSGNDVRSLTVVRMEVPCCGGIEYAARMALEQSGKRIPLCVVTLSIDGRILSEERA